MLQTSVLVKQMKSGLIICADRHRHGRLVRALAVFFLLFTGADLTLPQYFCGGEEVGGLPIHRSTVTFASDQSTDTNAVASSAVLSSSSDRPAPEAPHEEDCFCCCAHVLPSTVVADIGAAELKSQAARLGHISLQSPPLRGRYHPPRSA